MIISIQQTKNAVKVCPQSHTVDSMDCRTGYPHCSGLPKNMPFKFANLHVQISPDIWIQSVYLGMCYYQSSQGPLPTLPALPLWEGSSVRRAGVQSLSAWGVWKMLSWSCEPPDSLAYCLKEGEGREREGTVKKKKNERNTFQFSINLSNTVYIIYVPKTTCTIQ